MGQADSNSQNPSQKLSQIFLTEEEANAALAQERWKLFQREKAAEREKQARILREALSSEAGKVRSQLKLLHETTALPRIIRPDFSLQGITHLEMLIYSAHDAHINPDSPLWKGRVLPERTRLATLEEKDVYCPDSGILAPVGQEQAPEKASRDVYLPTGERLVATDKESQGFLDFASHYIAPREEDDPGAIVKFNHDYRLRENYAERTEIALDYSFTMYEIAKEFAKILLCAQHTEDANQRKKLSDTADELLMEFNLQRYGLFALLQNSHCDNKNIHVQEDRDFVQKLSRDLLIHALAERSYDLPTVNDLRTKEYQTDKQVTVESYFSAAYHHMQRVLGIRPHSNRVMEVPAIDASAIDHPTKYLH